MTTEEIRQTVLAALPDDASGMQRLNAERLISLYALAAQLHARATAGKRFDLDKLLRVEGMANRMARALGLDKPKPAPKWQPPWLQKQPA